MGICLHALEELYLQLGGKPQESLRLPSEYEKVDGTQKSLQQATEFTKLFIELIRLFKKYNTEMLRFPLL